MVQELTATHYAHLSEFEKFLLIRLNKLESLIINYFQPQQMTQGG